MLTLGLAVSLAINALNHVRFVREFIHNITDMKYDADFMCAMKLKLKKMDHGCCLPDVVTANSDFMCIVCIVCIKVCQAFDALCV